MALLPGEVFQYRGGPDPRLRKRSSVMLGRWAWSFLQPGITNAANQIYGSIFPGNGMELPPFTGLTRMIPWVVQAADMPYTTDRAGETFPSGTVFVVRGVAAPAGQMGVGINSGTPITTSLGICRQPYRSQMWVWVGYGIPSGASGTIALSKLTAGTALASLSILGTDGAVQILEIDPFAPFATDTVKVLSTWLGGSPTYQAIIPHPLYIADFVAVPDTLPGGYTARAGYEQFAQAIKTGARDYFRPGRATRQPLTPENRNLTGDTINLWIDGVLKRTTWIPGATNEDVQTATLVFSPDIHIPAHPPAPAIDIDVPPPADVIITGIGWREIRFHAQINSGSGTGANNFRFTITRSDTGAVFFDQTYASGSLVAGVDVTTGPIIPVTNAPITLTFHVYDQPYQYLGSGVTATLTASPQCGIPLPYVVSGPGDLVVPGGYDPANLTDPVNPAPLIRLGAGVTTYTPAIGSPLAFLPSANGWYKIVQGANTLWCSENEFTYSTGNGGTASRGHAGRPFYVPSAGTAAAAVLTAFTPSPTSIASGGTTVNCTQANILGFGSMAFPAAGTYEVAIKMSAGLASGIIFSWSASDSDVIDPDGVAIFEPWSILSGISPNTTSYVSTLNTPPATANPSVSAYIVGSSPTGAWVGHAGEIAIYNNSLGVWHFSIPEAGMHLSATVWYDGGQWRTLTDPVIKQRITVDAATTVYASFEPFTGSGVATLSVSWAAV